MANITQLQITGSSTVHNLNDARISATAVTTATHVLTANSGVTSIAPIAVADLASVLGAMQTVDLYRKDFDIDTMKQGETSGIYTVNNAATARTITNGPITDGGYSVIVHRHHPSYTPVIAVAYCNQPANIAKVAVRAYISDTWGAWAFLAYQ